MPFYPSIPASDGAYMTPVVNAVFEVYELSDTGFTKPLELLATSGLNGAPLITTQQGVCPPVNVVSPNLSHVFKSGEWEWRRDSFDGAAAAVEESAQQAAAARDAAQEAAENMLAPTDRAVAELLHSGLQTSAALRAEVEEGVTPELLEAALPPRLTPDGLATTYAPSTQRGDSWLSAWRSGDVEVLRSWFRANTGPRIPVDYTNTIRGLVTVSTQEQADALRGKVVVGQINITANDIELCDFVVQSTGAEFLIDATGALKRIHIHDFEADGRKNYSTVRGVGTNSGTGTPGEGVLVERGNIHSLCDGVGPAGGGTVRYTWIHDPILWDPETDGTYVSATDPHSDGVQVSSGAGIQMLRNFVEMVGNGAPNIVSGMIFNPKSAPVDNVRIKENYLAGGGYTLSFIDDVHGAPTNVVIENNRFGGGYVLGLFNYPAGAAPSFSGNLWMDNGEPVPTVSGVADKHPIIPAADSLSARYVETYLGIGSTTVWGGVNEARYLRALTPAEMSRVAVEVVTASGRISVGIYRASGDRMGKGPGKLVAFATVDCPAAGLRFITLNKKIDVRVGDYLAMSCDNTTAAFLGFSGTPSQIYGNQFYRSADSFPLPSTAPSMSTGGFRMPILAGAL